jgi:CheY-like chemotaxis protein
MGGDIKVSTARGKGTEFTITVDFEIASGPAAGKEEAAAKEDEGGIDFSGKRILLAEDNEINREIAVEVLADAGFDVDSAENGQVAFEKVRDGGARRYDAVVMDVQMPIMGGYEATRAIRALGVAGVSDVPIVALSANAFESDVKAALAAGMDAHVAKPLHIPELMAALSKIIYNRRANAADTNRKEKGTDAEQTA